MHDLQWLPGNLYLIKTVKGKLFFIAHGKFLILKINHEIFANFSLYNRSLKITKLQALQESHINRL